MHAKVWTLSHLCKPMSSLRIPRPAGPLRYREKSARPLTRLFTPRAQILFARAEISLQYNGCIVVHHVFLSLTPNQIQGPGRSEPRSTRSLDCYCCNTAKWSGFFFCCSLFRCRGFRERPVVRRRSRRLGCLYRGTVSSKAFLWEAGRLTDLLGLRSFGGKTLSHSLRAPSTGEEGPLASSSQLRGESFHVGSRRDSLGESLEASV